MKIALCCIVKNENDYLKEYVEYYHNLGVNHIFIYDDNDIDGENPKDVIGDYDYVTIIDYRGRRTCQNQSYIECYNTYHNDYDWMMFFDADEFLDVKNDTLENYLNRECFKDAHTILIPWRDYDDNNLLGNENNNDRSLVKRFTHTRETAHPDTHRLSKSIVNCRLERNLSFSPHYIGDKHNCFDSDGTPSSVLGESKQTYDYAEIKHYRKTIIEFIQHKLNRGWADGNSFVLTTDYFWGYSDKTPEKEEIVKKYLKDGKI